MSQVVVVIGGGGLLARANVLVEPDAVVIAADSGLDRAREAGLTPDVLVGDLDSISAGGRMWAYAHDVEIHEFPTDKDVTDTGLALSVAAGTAGATDLLLLGGDGDRLDHTLGSVIALGAPELARLESVRALIGATRIHVLHPGRSVALLDELPGTTFSLLALHGSCTGVTIADARWPLTDATLPPASTVGISNETSDQPGQATQISVAGGVLTVVIP
ncbi:MAG: thiamine diphosphokinase [Ilumatobacteraceae bacterium]